VKTYFEEYENLKKEHHETILILRQVTDYFLFYFNLCSSYRREVEEKNEEIKDLHRQLNLLRLEGETKPKQTEVRS
jgi:hypothetical protein